MFSAFQTFGRLGAGGLPFSERALWPQGASSPGLWIDPAYTPSEFQDSAGTTPISAIGTVADSSNPVGLILDRKAGATSNTGAGIHLSQSTSAARPLASARVNLLTYSEDFSNAEWTKMAVNLSGGTLIPTTENTYHSIRQQVTLGVMPMALIFEAKAAGYTDVGTYITDNTTGGIAAVFTLSGAGSISSTASDGSWTGMTSTITALSDGWYRCVLSGNKGAGTIAVPYIAPGASQATSFAGDGVSGISVRNVQVNTGLSALPYQRVGAASDYDTAGFPVYLKLDGTDDGLASATFSAGTLTSSMDCLIALRRDSAERFILFYQEVGVGSFYFGLVDAAGGSSPCFNASGSPTVWVDGTQVSSGRASDLSTALTLGSWHILEFRGMDLSAWARLQSGFWASGYGFNGAIGKAYLFSNGQDANRTKARARMAAYFGVTLP